MRSLNVLSVVLLALLLTAQALPAAAGPAAPPGTFNVVRLGEYPAESPETSGDYSLVSAIGNVAFLVDNHYDNAAPPNSYFAVDNHDIADPQNPHYRRTTAFEEAETVNDLDGDEYHLALSVSLKSWYSSIGGMKVYDNDSLLCWYNFDWSTQGMAYSVVLDDLLVYVGLAKGLMALSYEEAADEPCDTFPDPGQPTLFPTTSAVYEIERAGNFMYLGEFYGVQVVNATSWPPSEVAFYPTPDPVYDLAVSPGNFIYAGTSGGLYIIDAASGEVLPRYGPDTDVKVVVDGSTAYLGTDLDLQVLDVSDPRAPVLIGSYADKDMDFERSLAFDRGLVHTPKGIFKYQPDLLLQTYGPGITVNGTAVAAGASVAVKPGDSVALPAPGARASLKAACSPGQQLTVAQLQAIRSRYLVEHTPETMFEITEEMTVLGEFVAAECGKQQLAAAAAAGPPALPLRLQSGGLELAVPATVGAFSVETPNAVALATGGTTLEAGHDPDAGLSEFVCRAGALQVQPVVAGAPPVTLGPGQYVLVTPSGAGTVGQLRFVYLPVLN